MLNFHDCKPQEIQLLEGCTLMITFSDDKHEKNQIPTLMMLQSHRISPNMYAAVKVTEIADMER